MSPRRPVLADRSSGRLFAAAGRRSYRCPPSGPLPRARQRTPRGPREGLV